MDKKEISRRQFVINSSAAVSSGWLLANLPEILLAQEHAHLAAQSTPPTKFEFLTAEQAADIEAIAAQIVPTDETPGAREARVVYFIDRALMTFAADQRSAMTKGLRQLESKVHRHFRAARRFSALNSEQQIKVLKSIEKSDFFEMVRTLTITGMFANPSYGGNYNRIGWELIGFEDKFMFEPPFGYYDSGYRDKNQA